jgi:hypothetical protein
MSELAATVPEAAHQWNALGYRLAAWPAADGKAPRQRGWGATGTDPDRIGSEHNIGVLHGLSGTCALDLDDLPRSIAVLEFVGLDLDALQKSTTTWRGKPERLKLLFRAPNPALGVRKLKVFLDPQREPVTVLELRGAELGKQAQDVLPPSRHPDTGKPYELLSPLRSQADLPKLPRPLIEIWRHWNAWEPILRRVLGDQRIAAEDAAHARLTRARLDDGVSVIDEFNARHMPGEVLERNGYARHGARRWLRPGSTTGVPGVVLLPGDRAVYSHGGGALDDKRPHDAFDCYRLLEHAGDFTAAVRTAARELGLERSAPVAMRSSTATTQDAAAPPDKSSSRIKLRPLAEIVAERRTVRWLLPKVIEAGVLAVLVGRRGSFKSFVALDWGMRCASAGHPVVILSGEGAGLDRRVDAWLRAHGAGIELDRLPIHALERAVNLNSRDILAELASAIDAASIEPELVIVDTMSKYSPGLDENSNAEAALFLAGLSVELRERYTCSVLLVAHTGHGDQKRARGASALGANTDAEYLVDRQEGTNTATVSRSRFKDFAELPPLAYTAEVVDLGRVDEDGDRVTSLVMRAVDAPTPQSAPRIIGKNMVAAATALREWARTRPDARHIATAELTALLEGHGINRKRRLEVINGLISLRALTASIGGYTLDSSVLEQ